MSVLLLRNAFRRLPEELLDAALVDGCGYMRFFFYVTLPLSLPILATVAIVTFVASWNNFLLPLVVFNDSTWWTLPLGVTQFQGQYAADIARILAYVVLAMVPALALYVLAERQLIGGLTAGASKG
jgi:raffinose/stachyose/melibiose transport system permease protein